MGAGGLRRADWGGAAALARRTAELAALAGAMLLLCRAQPAAGLAPFGMAFMAAALMAGGSAAALVAGCLLGAMRGGLADFQVALPVGAAVVLGGSLAGEALLPGWRRRLRDWRLQLADALARRGDSPALRRVRSAIRPAPPRQARSPNRGLVGCAALAGLGALAPLAFAGGEPWPSAQALGSSLAAVAAAPFIRPALDVRPDRKRLSTEERCGLGLLAGGLAAGLATLSIPAALCACGAMTLLLYPCGALAGAWLGAALLLARGDARLAALMAAGGAAAQLCGAVSRRAREGVYFAATLFAALFTGVPAPWLAGACGAVLVVMLLPSRWLRVPETWARPTPACDPGRVAARMARRAAGRMRDLAAAFGDMAGGMLTPESLGDEAMLAEKLRARLCEGCAGYAGCWSGDDARAARLVCDLIAAATEWSEGGMERPLFDGGAPNGLARRCRRGGLIPARVGIILEDFARERREAAKRGAAHRIAAAQFSQARRLLESLAAERTRPARPDAALTARAASALARAGFWAEEVTALEGGEIVALETSNWTRGAARRAAAGLSRALGRAYVPAEIIGREAWFARRAWLRVQTGAASLAREDGAPSGDSHLARVLDGERLLALVCDGMGSGEAAARESAAAVRLLERLLAAGASGGAAIEAVNALLLNRGGEDMFATVDLLLVNLETGEAELTKLAAGPTLLLRGGEATWIEGGRLPLGILEKVPGAPRRLRLAPGDVVLMGSDGVMDAAGADALERAAMEGGDADAVARRAVACAEAACAGGRRDDMTALCLRFGA